MTGHSPNRRWLVPAAPILVLLGWALLFGAGGCGDDESTPSFPPPPNPQFRPWFLDVWGTAADDITVVGRPGLIVHWDGAAWTVRPSPTNADLTGIWGTGPANKYIVGHRGTVLRNTGGGWNAVSSPTGRNLFDIGVGPGGHAYVCGERGELWRLDPATGGWTPTADSIARRNLAGVVVDTLYRSEGEVRSLTSVSRYAISGSDGMALMEDSIFGWRLGAVGTTAWLNASWGSETLTDNWLASDTGKLYRLQEVQGQLSWRERASPVREGAITCIWGAPGGTVYYYGTRDGRIVRGTLVGDNVQHQVVYTAGLWVSAIWGSAADNIYAVGYDARVWRYDGAAWTVVPVTVPEPQAMATGGPETDPYGRPLLD